MIVGKPPYFSPNREEMLQNIEDNKIVMPTNISKECYNIIQQLLEKNPMARLGASQNDANDIKAHPFFKGINWVDLTNRYIRVLNIYSKYKPLPITINQDVLNAKFDIPFDFILSADKSSQLNYIQGWSFVNHDPNA
jgi:serine/threonine protein kinase